ncbi:MAG TPA: hypothetical protein VK004_03105 [Ignavibacteria bacterium]|nr:hypothetical protein [Ignavibacteria bacterium]
MKKVVLPSLLLLIAAIISGCSGVSSEYRTFEQQVQEEIPNMIWMLEQDKRAEFLQKYVSPEFIEQKGGLVEVTNEFDPDSAEELIKYLKLAQETTPTIDSKNLTVTFDGTDFPRPLVFRKEAGVWRILD